MGAPRLHRLAGGVIDHRIWVLAGLIALTVGLGLQIPRVQADFTPSDLFASFEGQQELEDEVRATFGAVDNVVLILLLMEGGDALDRQALQWQHELAGAAGRVAGVERVDGLTVTPVPRLVAGGGQGGPDALRALPPIIVTEGLLRATGVLGHDETAGIDRPTLEPRAGPVVSGRSVTDAEAAELREALEHAPLLRGRLVSQDGQTAAIAVTMDRSITRNTDIAAVVEDLMALVQERAAPDGGRVVMSGLPLVRYMLVERMRQDQSVLMPAAVIVCLLILLVAFRWIPALILPLASVGVGAVWLVGGMALVGEPFNIINNIVPMMVIIIGISNAIHLLSRYGEECQGPGNRREAAIRAMVAMIIACFLTSFTTAVGFASLGISQTEILARFGLTAAAGVMLVYISTLLILPASLTLVPRPGKSSLVAREGALERGVSHLAALMIRHARPVAALSLLAFAAALSSAAFIRIDSAVLDQFDPDDEIHRSMRLVEAELGGLRPLDIILRTDNPDLFTDPDFTAAIDAFVHDALDRTGVLSGESWIALLREARVMARRDPDARTAPLDRHEEIASLLQLVAGAGEGPLAGYLTPARDRARIQLRVADMGAQATIRLAHDLDDDLRQRLEPFPVSHELAGDAWTGSRGLDIVIRDLMGSLLLAFLIIFGFLALLLRSLRLGLLSILPNVLPLVLTLLWMVLRDIPLNTATAIIFSISIGLAVDGTIHMLVRFREERRTGLSIEDAIARSSRGTGRAIVLTCASLVLGFGVMLLSAFVPVRRFGELIAVTVIGVLIGTLIVLPALMALFAPRRPSAHDET